MKNYRTKLAVMLIIVAITVTAVNCTKNNQVIGTPTPAAANTDTLYTVSGSPSFQPQAAVGGYATAWNGDTSAWTSVPRLTVPVTVPSPGGNIFNGFNGNTTNVTMQSMYDANNIYFLFRWNCDQQNCASSPWYYTPGASGYNYWAQEGGGPSPTSTGAVTFRPPFIQDEFVIMFNIANSCPTFNTLSCYAACHVFSNYISPTDTLNNQPNGAMWTNGPTEFLDCWRARTLQVLNENQANDTYIWNGNGELNKQEVSSDYPISPATSTSGGFSNKQTIKVTGTSTKVTVPWYAYPTGSYSIYPLQASGPYGAILQSDTGTKAFRVTAVDSNGVLTLSNGTSIDPRTAANGTNYQQVGMGDGNYCIPGSVVSPYINSRADVTANMFWTGGGWELLLVRKLTTGDATHDVDFSTYATTSRNFPFGIGVMFNGADNEHAIATGLILHFK